MRLLVAAGVGFAAAAVASALAWHRALSACDARIGRWRVIRCYAAGSFANTLAPAHAGEAVRVALLSSAIGSEGAAFTTIGVAAAVSADARRDRRGRVRYGRRPGPIAALDCARSLRRCRSGRRRALGREPACRVRPCRSPPRHRSRGRSEPDRGDRVRRLAAREHRRQAGSCGLRRSRARPRASRRGGARDRPGARARRPPAVDAGQHRADERGGRDRTSGLRSAARAGACDRDRAARGRDARRAHPRRRVRPLAHARVGLRLRARLARPLLAAAAAALLVGAVASTVVGLHAGLT